jgi:hypothetical protein
MLLDPPASTDTQYITLMEDMKLDLAALQARLAYAASLPCLQLSWAPAAQLQAARCDSGPQCSNPSLACASSSLQLLGR